MVGILVTKKATLSILMDVSGVIKLGRMTLLLGPPSPGKTTLLLALVGRLAKNLEVLGKVIYNGHRLTDFVPEKTSSYISQHDILVAVRETVESAALCQGLGNPFNIVTKLGSQDFVTKLGNRVRERKIHPDPEVNFFMKGVAMQESSSGQVTNCILKILELDIGADTMIGNDMGKRISWGQQKRGTAGELAVGHITAMFMDEICTGLDSSTTYQIIKCFGDIAHILEITLVISLLQPAPETYNLFDDIILLSEGQVVYHGPPESIVGFFEACGYKCLERKGVGDFLQEVTSKKDQEQYWLDKDKPYHYTTVNDFVEAYKIYRVGETMAGELAL